MKRTIYFGNTASKYASKRISPRAVVIVRGDIEWEEVSELTKSNMHLYCPRYSRKVIENHGVAAVQQVVGGYVIHFNRSMGTEAKNCVIGNAKHFPDAEEFLEQARAILAMEDLAQP